MICTLFGPELWHTSMFLLLVCSFDVYLFFYRAWKKEALSSPCLHHPVLVSLLLTLGQHKYLWRNVVNQLKQWPFWKITKYNIVLELNILWESENKYLAA